MLVCSLIRRLGNTFDHARNYNSATGDFTAQDPSGFQAGSDNLYGYVGESPIDDVDPTGLYSWGDFVHSVGDYGYYVTHPNMMDADLQHAQQQATIVAAVSLTVATAGMSGAMASGAAGMNFGLASGAWGTIAGSSCVMVYGGDPLLGALHGAQIASIGADLALLGGPLLLRSGGLGSSECMNWCGVNCFPAGTLVTTEVGPKPIEKISAGEKVWAKDVANDTWTLCLVSKTFSIFHCGDFASIDFAGETITSTGNHPFWVVEGVELEKHRKPTHTEPFKPGARVPGRWVDARDLRAGDSLLRRSGETAKVNAVTTSEQSLVVFNLRVADVHTYAVGNNEILVHNNSSCLPADAIVVRGGMCETEQIKAGTGTHSSGITGFSVKAPPTSR